MKTILFCLLFLFVVQPVHANDSFVLEAENSSGINGSRRVRDSRASQGEVAEMADKSNMLKSYIRYDFKINSAKTYRLWLRTQGVAKQKSVFIDLKGPKDIKNMAAIFPASGLNYDWKSYFQVQLPKGSYTLFLRNREPQARIDQIIVTSDLGYKPRGAVTSLNANEKPPGAPTPRPTATPAVGGSDTRNGVDISKFSIKGPAAEVADLKRLLAKTKNYDGGNKGVIEIIQDNRLADEAIRIEVTDSKVSIRGNPAKWAVTEFARQHLKARFVLPGNIGDAVQPQLLKIAKGIHEYRPELVRRDFRQGDNKNLVQWTDRFYLSKKRSGGRTWGHYGGHWWQKYSKSHSYLFARNPEGKISLMRQDQPERAKLNISERRVIDMIKKEYIAAGKPPYQSLSATDSAGYDTSPESMRMYGFANTLENRKKVWTGGKDLGSLTDGFVQFWNETYDELKKVNPDVKIGVYAYSAYRECPKDTRLRPNAFSVQVVPTWYEGDMRIWECWGRQADDVFLRPNWAWNIYSAPYLPLRDMDQFINNAHRYGMKGMDFDSLTGFFGVNGIFSYYIMEKMVDPAKPLETIVNDWASAFGEAKTEMKAFVEYWLDYGDRIQMPSSSGGGEGGDPRGLYTTKFKAAKLPNLNPLAGAFFSLPILYGDDVLNPALRILDAAEKKAQGENKARIQYIQSAYSVFKLQRTYADLMTSVCIRKDKSKYAAARAAQQKFSAAHFKQYGTKNEGITEWAINQCKGISNLGL